VEVDFVVHGEAGFWAVEVQNSIRVRPADLRPLKTFASDYPECTPVLLYRGDDRLRIDGILCVSVEEFLREMRPHRGLSAFAE
jgi:hypothetical protein